MKEGKRRRKRQGSPEDGGIQGGKRSDRGREQMGVTSDKWMRNDQKRGEGEQRCGENGVSGGKMERCGEV